MIGEIWYAVYDDFSDLAGRDTHHLRCKFLRETEAREYLEFIRARYPSFRFVLYEVINHQAKRLDG